MFEVTASGSEIAAFAKNALNIKYNLVPSPSNNISLEELQKLTGNKVKIDSFFQNPLSLESNLENLSKHIASTYNDPLPGLTEPNNILNSQDIVITNGSIGAARIIFESLIKKTDHVICLVPTWEELFRFPVEIGAEVSYLKCQQEDNWLPNLTELENLIQPNTKLIVLNSPCNPTGAILSKNILENIVEMAKKKDIWIFCDEVFRPCFHITNEPIPPSILELDYAYTVSSGSTSKSYSATGLRVGWVASKNTNFINKVKEKIGDNSFVSNTITTTIAEYLLEPTNRGKLLTRNRINNIASLDVLDKMIAKSNGKLSWVRPNAGNTSFIRFENVDDTYSLFKELTQKWDVVASPGEAYGYPGYFRVCFSNNVADIEGGLKAILNCLDSK